MKWSVFKINVKPAKYVNLVLGLLPFVLTVVWYMYTSYERHQTNPDDKVMPGIVQIAERIKECTFSVRTENQFDKEGNMTVYQGPKTFGEAYDTGAQRDGFSGGVKEMWKFYQQGESQVWKDFIATMYRFFIALGIVFLSVFLGLFMGCFPYVESLLYKYVLFFDKIPTLVLTPIIFIFVSVGNPAIITLIVLAVAPTVILDTYLKVKEVPREQRIKGMTLKASTMENVFRITYAQIMPKVYDTIRLNFKSIINVLVVGELLGAEAGLGYRIFLVRRFMDMATIIPYIVLLGIIIYLLDYWVRKYNASHFRWVNQ